MKKKEYTKIESQLITVITDFINWSTPEGLPENYTDSWELAKKYMDNRTSSYNYNKWFRTTKQDVIEYIENECPEENR